MTLALRLSEQGFMITLIESEPEIGGLLSPCKIGNYTWDRFYHVILLSDLHLLSLLEELELTNLIQWGETKTGFFTDGNFYSMSNISEFLTFPPLTLLEKVRLGWTLWYASKIKAWQKLEKISSVEWLIRLSGKRTFDKIWLPLLKSKLGENYKITSASFIWAIIVRMYSARQSGLKKEMFGYLDGGYTTVIDRFQSLLESKGVDIHTQTKVTKVQNNNAGVKIETTGEKSIKFDEAILTIPCSQISDICPQLSLSEQKKLDKVNYQGILCAILILKNPLNEYYITNITDEQIPFTAVIEMTALINKKYFDGNTLIYLPLYLKQKDAYWYRQDEEIKDEFLSSLKKMYPSIKEDNLLYFKIEKADNVLPIISINYSSKLLPQTRTSLKHVFLVNSAQIPNGTMNANEIVSLANRKAGEIAKLISI